MQAARLRRFNDHFSRSRPQDPGSDRLSERAGGRDLFLEFISRRPDRLEQPGAPIGQGQYPDFSLGPRVEDSGPQRCRGF